MKSGKQLTLFFFLLVSGLSGQQSDRSFRSDSLKNKFEKDSVFIYRKKKIKPYANIDFRNAFVDNNFLSLAGLRLGVTLHNRHTFGLAAYMLNEFSIFKSNRVRTYEFDKINYLTLVYEYILHDGKYLDIHFPFELGYGNYSAHPVNADSGSSVNSNMIPTGIGVKLLLMPNSWVGIKFGGGYRYIKELNSNVGLDGLYFSIGIRVDLAKTYQDIRYFRARKEYKRQLSLLK